MTGSFVTSARDNGVKFGKGIKVERGLLRLEAVRNQPIDEGHGEVDRTMLELFIKIILLTGAQNDPVLTSPARLNVAIITPDGEDLDSTNV